MFDQNLFLLKFFLTKFFLPIFFPQKIYDGKFVFTKKNFNPKFFFNRNFFYWKFFLTNNFFDQNFLFTKIFFFDKKIILNWKQFFRIFKTKQLVLTLKQLNLVRGKYYKLSAFQLNQSYLNYTEENFWNGLLNLSFKAQILI